MSLSSGEAETYGVTKACSRALGMRFVAVDMGLGLHGPLSLEVDTDSSAAHRRGSGKIRHLEAGCLWIQQAIASGKIAALVRAPGMLNEPDIFTKGVGRQDLQRHLKSLRVEVGAELSDPGGFLAPQRSSAQAQFEPNAVFAVAGRTGL